jgi:hypothetical protein
MNFSLVIGIALVIYSIVTLYARIAGKDWFWKDNPMKRTWGPVLGNLIHIMAYTVLPAVVGIVFTWSGLQQAGMGT